MSIRPEIPDVQGVKDEATTKILRAIKSAFDSVTGRSQPKIKTLGSNANFFGTVKKVNEIINRLQGDPSLDLGAVTTIPEQGGAIAGSGTVTAITAGTGLDGGTITASGTISISTQITAGGPVGSAATVPVVTFNAQGQVTAVSTATITPAAIGAPSGSGTSTGTNTGDQTTIPYITAGIYVAPSITDNGNGTLTLGSGEYVFATDANGTYPYQKFTIAGDTYALTDNVQNNLVANYNGGSPTITVVLTAATVDNLTVIPVLTTFRLGTHVDYLEWGLPAKGLANRLMRRLVRTERFSHEPGGLVLGEVATRTVTITAGNVWSGPNQNVLSAFTSATDALRLYVHVAGVFTKSTITQYDNTQYDDGTSAQTLTANRYAVNWVFRAVNSNQQEVYIVLGAGDYTLNQAQASMIPASLPAEITSTAVLVGRIIVQKSASSATEIDSAFTQSFVPTAASDHSGLSNLTWTSSGHTGTAGAVAMFDEATGAATEIALSNVLAFAATQG